MTPQELFILVAWWRSSLYEQHGPVEGELVLTRLSMKEALSAWRR